MANATAFWILDHHTRLGWFNVTGQAWVLSSSILARNETVAASSCCRCIPRLPAIHVGRQCFAACSWDAYLRAPVAHAYLPPASRQSLILYCVRTNTQKVGLTERRVGNFHPLTRSILKLEWYAADCIPRPLIPCKIVTVKRTPCKTYVVVQLVKTKCLSILCYGIEVCPANKLYIIKHSEIKRRRVVL